MQGKIAEIFKSIQGEGIYAGRPQVFVRFYGCQTHCRFCDTQLNRYDKKSPFELIREVKALSNGWRSLAITGGEPLEQAGFLKAFLSLSKQENFKIYLETNGILHNELESVVDLVDTVAMDIKLPSSAGTRAYWQEHKNFLEAGKAREIFVKIVVCFSTQKDDLEKAIELVRGVSSKIPVVLQPNTFELTRDLWERAVEFQRIALESLEDVRIVPQIHKLLGRR